MTSAWFAHLADNALAAADFIGQDNPALARLFVDAAASAKELSHDLAHQESLAAIGDELSAIKLGLVARAEQD